MYIYLPLDSLSCTSSPFALPTLLSSFGRSGYPPNTICEYHFIIRKISKVYFSKIHLDVGPNDPATGIGNFRECKRVSESSFKSRDFISLNTVHSSRVFCGRPSRSVNRKVKQQKLQSNNRELIITFWSDASYSGDGFDGYFVDLRQRPPRGYRPADASKCDDTACGRITFDICMSKQLDYCRCDCINLSLSFVVAWGMLEKVLDNKTESLNNLNGMDVLIEWLKSQSYSIDSEIHALWDGTPSRTSSSNRTAHTLTSFEESSTTSTPTNPSLSASTHSTRLPETVSTKQTYSSQVEKTGKSQSYSKRSSSPPFVVSILLCDQTLEFLVL